MQPASKLSASQGEGYFIKMMSTEAHPQAKHIRWPLGLRLGAQPSTKLKLILKQDELLIISTAVDCQGACTTASNPGPTARLGLA